ncbi:transmembrane protein 272-like [Leptodactylus fuscus]
MIVMGGLYKDDCLIQPNIPIFLLVTGVTHFLISFILLLRILCHLFSQFLDTVIFAFMFCWFITGSFWIFDMFDQKDGKCAPSLYLFAYGTMAFEWIILWLACMCYYCCSKPQRQGYM